MYNVKGTVMYILPLQQGTKKDGSSWFKQTIVIEIQDEYGKKNMLAIDNWSMPEEFGKLTPGTTGQFSLKFESKEFQGKWFTNARCVSWTLENGADSTTSITTNPSSQTAPQTPPPPTTEPASAPTTGGWMGESLEPQDDDLPF